MLVVVRIGIEPPGVIPSTKKFGNRFGSDDRKRSANKINADADVDFADVDAVEVNDFPFERQEMIGMR